MCRVNMESLLTLKNLVDTEMTIQEQYASNLKHERHRNYTELIYWHDQWKLLAENAMKELDAAQQQITLVREVLSQDLKISSERVLTLEVENQHLQQQIDTLTKERNDARHQVMELIAIMDKMGTEI